MSNWLPDEDRQCFQNPELFHEVMARYRRVLGGDGYAFWEWGLHNNTYKCGGSFWQKLGYTSEIEAINTVDSAQEYIHPDDFHYVNTIILDHLRFNKPINMVYRIKAADGTYCWTQANATSTRDENGRVTYITGVTFDLSHLKETEKALRLSEARHERVLSASNDGIWEWSALDANDSPKKAGRVGKFHTSYSCWEPLGYSADEVDAIPETQRLDVWKSHIHPDDLPKINGAIRNYFVSREPMDIEYRVFADGGKMLWMRSRGTGGFNSFGRLIVFSGVNIDITQLKESEERVRLAKVEAEKANQSKSRFLSNMSHELRTPLNAIIGFSQLLGSGENLTEQQKEHVNCINDAGRHLLQLINDVLDLAQVEVGKLSLSMETMDPVIVAKDCFNYFKPIASKRNIDLHLSVDKAETVGIKADVVRLRQCLLNLLSNAIKYNFDYGSIYIDIKHQDQSLIIDVRDTGPGIPSDRVKDLFRVFNRLGAENSAIEGSGIGLVITQQLTEAMGGKINYCDEWQQGGCFRLTFPVSDQPIPDLSFNSVVATPEQLIFDHPINLIYIEDNIANIKLLEAWLAPYPQIQLTAESDPIIGLHRIRSSIPDIVLLDIHMPELSGTEILSVLKGSPLTDSIPVVALSASAMEKDIKKGQALGVDAYLTKPLDIQKLLGIFNNLFASEAA